jgi:hypothetical protein
MRVRALLVLGAVIAVSMTATAAADAASLRKFSVRDSGARIRWSVDVCTAGTTRVRAFRAWLEPEALRIIYHRRWNGGRTGPGCDRWIMRTRDMWSAQVWSSQLTVVMSNGQILRTRVRDFNIE